MLGDKNLVAEPTAADVTADPGSCSCDQARAPRHGGAHSFLPVLLFLGTLAGLVRRR